MRTLQASSSRIFHCYIIILVLGFICSDQTYPLTIALRWSSGLGAYTQCYLWTSFSSSRNFCLSWWSRDRSGLWTPSIFWYNIFSHYPRKDSCWDSIVRYDETAAASGQTVVPPDSIYIVDCSMLEGYLNRHCRGSFKSESLWVQLTYSSHNDDNTYPQLQLAHRHSVGRGRFAIAHEGNETLCCIRCIAIATETCTVVQGLL